jgi:hypothetical protein
MDHAAPLLNSLLAKDNAPYNSEVTAQLLGLVGSRRTRQLTNLLTNGSPGTWKLFLLATMPNADPSVVEASLKALLGLHYGREAALTLTTLLPHLRQTELGEFSKSLVLNACLKFFRQEGDPYLRKVSLCVLSEIYGSVNLPAEGEHELFASLTAVVTEQQLPTELMALAVVLARKIVQEDAKVLQQGTVAKLLISRLLPLASCQEGYRPLQAAVLELFKAVLGLERHDLLAGADLIDLALPFLSLLDKQQTLPNSHLLLLSSALDILYLSCHNEPDLPKYLLTSTRLQSQLLNAISLDLRGESTTAFLESLSRLWLILSIN